MKFLTESGLRTCIGTLKTFINSEGVSIPNYDLYKEGILTMCEAIVARHSKKFGLVAYPPEWKIGE